MSFGFSIGDFIAVGTLLATTIRKCKTASTEFEELSQILQTTWYCLEGARNTLDDVYEALPAIHRASLASAMTGLKNVVTNIDLELDRYADLAPNGMQLVKLRFALLADPRVAESKLTLHLSIFNMAISIIMCDSITKSTIHSYDTSSMVAAVQAQPISVSSPQQTTTSQQIAVSSFAQDWITAATASGTISQVLSRRFSARGFYDYAPTTSPAPNLPKRDTVEYRLCISGSRIYGTCKDSVGESTVEGSIDIQRDAVRFVKYYGGAKRHLRWEYVGCFMSCGIVGEWHYPDDPPDLRHHRGRFAIWLLSDEDAQGDQLETQLRMLKNEGRILTRSLSFNTRVVNVK
ncbi:hypothetical protein V8E51_011561 [Hyaloscypha variabilis]